MSLEAVCATMSERRKCKATTNDEEKIVILRVDINMRDAGRLGEGRGRVEGAR